MSTCISVPQLQEVVVVAVFEFTAVAHEREAHSEQGTIVARDKLEAYDKLRSRQFTDIRLKKVQGMQAWIRQFTADVR
jgi:type II secretory pathway component PulF